MSENWKSECSLAVLKQRAFLMSKIREYFYQQNVMEVETPILSSAGNTDVNIESFTADNIQNNNPVSYLRTSPEFPLKRLLSSGIGDIFELGKVFRKGEVSKAHNVEFTMLEWYRLNFGYHQLIQDVTDLFYSILCAFKWPQPESVIVTFKEAFENSLAIDIEQVSVQQLNRISEKYNYSGSQLTHDEALDYLFATQVQAGFNKETLTFVTEYPSSQAALAQINPENLNTSLRFEVFYHGHELGNGYQELTNAKELLERFESDNRHRKKRGLPEVNIDQQLITAMHHGMPDCSGIAIGVDRLLMVLLKLNSINGVLTFHAKNA